MSFYIKYPICFSDCGKKKLTFVILKYILGCQNSLKVARHEWDKKLSRTVYLWGLFYIFHQFHPVCVSWLTWGVTSTPANLVRNRNSDKKQMKRSCLIWWISEIFHTTKEQMEEHFLPRQIMSECQSFTKTVSRHPAYTDSPDYPRQKHTQVLQWLWLNSCSWGSCAIGCARLPEAK